jgi:hypothetical protein
LRRELNAAPSSEETLGAVEDIISFLRRPTVTVRAYQEFGRSRDLARLLEVIRDLPATEAAPPSENGDRGALRREDLHLVCFDFVWS